MVDALCKELELRAFELDEDVETIYFGGGTPSLLNAQEIAKILDSVYSIYSVINAPEITLEANPDAARDGKSLIGDIQSVLMFA